MSDPIELEVLVTELVGYHAAERRTAARQWLQAALAARLGADAADLSFHDGLHGKPALVGVADLAFNLSHSGATAMLAIARGAHLEVGVDVERLDRRVPIDRAGRRAFDDRERALVANDQPGLLRLWVAKEALLKATGDGVSAGLDAVRLERDEAGALQGRWRDEGAVAPVTIGATGDAVWALTAYRVGPAGVREWLRPQVTVR